MRGIAKLGVFYYIVGCCCGTKKWRREAHTNDEDVLQLNIVDSIADYSDEKI